MNKEQLEKYLTLAVSTGADFAEIYFEDTRNKSYNFNDSKLDTINSSNYRGIGIKITKGTDCYYASTNKIDEESIIETIKSLILNFSENKKENIVLNNLKEKYVNIKIKHDELPIAKKKSIFINIDNKVREKYKEITQVSLGFIENEKYITVANSNGTYIKTNSYRTRFIGLFYTEDENEKANEFLSYGKSKGYEILDEFNLEEESLKTAQSAVDKLTAKDFKGGELPVIIAPGFGAVIFHEACGHGLEATSVATDQSVFCNLQGKKIASDKVTLIDDGTIENEWGSNIFDDEGNYTQKNILIENGILKEYLVDTINIKRMNSNSNGCGRRQNYDYAPTSRMSNTYIAPGNDTFEDMLKSIELGVYCKRMSGGSVNPTTGDFNFAVDTAYLIEKGKITDMIKGITLIGNSKDVLHQVEMVSNDLVLSDGYCGSKSGMVPVTIGQPTIKISKILVGGKE